MQLLNLQGGEKNSIIMWKNDSCYCIHYLEIYGLPGRRCVSEEVLYCLQNQSISLKDTSVLSSSSLVKPYFIFCQPVRRKKEA